MSSSSSTSYLSDYIRNKLENEDHKRAEEDDNKSNDEVVVEDKEEEEEGCGRCILEEIFESSVCGKEIKARRKCMNAAETEQDVEKCVELHENMLKCIQDNETYYKAIFEAIFKDANNQDQSSNNNVQSPAAEQEEIIP